MRAIAASLSDQDIADLSPSTSSTARLPSRPWPTRCPPAVGRRGRAADQGRLRVLPRRQLQQAHRRVSYPKIAGQHADYLYVALKSYQVEGNPNVGRANAIMAGQVKQFKLAELKAMARYIGSLPGELPRCRSRASADPARPMRRDRFPRCGLFPARDRPRAPSAISVGPVASALNGRQFAADIDVRHASNLLPRSPLPPAMLKKITVATCAWACTCMPWRARGSTTRSGSPASRHRQADLRRCGQAR
jgi:cytochrome c553